MSTPDIKQAIDDLHRMEQEEQHDDTPNGHKGDAEGASASEEASALAVSELEPETSPAAAAISSRAAA